MSSNPFIDLRIAHQSSSGHRKQIQESELCGCYYCQSTFPPSVIEEWVDEDEFEVGQTAVCPKCGIDSVIGSKAGFPLNPEFLGNMNKHWF
ncbi:MAG: hypothetical protein SynsKO_44660 [Synoicihabitans sp.]